MWFFSKTKPKSKSKLDSLLDRYDIALNNLVETINNFSSVPNEKLFSDLAPVQKSSDLATVQKNFTRTRDKDDKEAKSQLLLEAILAVLVTRDALQKELAKAEVSTNHLLEVSKLDSKFREQIKQLPQKVTWQARRYLLTQLETIRAFSNPSSNSWWWFPNIPVHSWDKLDLAWETLTFIWLASIFSLFVDIASRFVSGGAGLGIGGSFAVICQSILALAGGGALTQTGQKTVESTLKKWGIPKHWWQETKFGAASLLLLFFIGFRLCLPRIAIEYNNSGFQDYQNGQLDSAESKYKRAVELNPNYTEVHYNLGLLHEDLQNLKQAQTQYSLAVQSGFPPANNNLARLYILSDKVPAAVNLLLKGIYQLENEPKFRQIEGKEQIQYSLLKNLGWARLKQERYAEAKDALEVAITIKNIPKQASAYCLLAQAIEKLNPPNQEAWQQALTNCLEYPINRHNPEEDEWVYQAQQKQTKRKKIQ